MNRLINNLKLITLFDFYFVSTNPRLPCNAQFLQGTLKPFSDGNYSGPFTDSKEHRLHSMHHISSTDADAVKSICSMDIFQDWNNRDMFQSYGILQCLTAG